MICKKNEDEAKSLKEGEIYYRYRGRTQTIRYVELKELIDERRKREQLLWFKHLKDIARIGIADAALLDLRTGMVKGAGANLVIDQSLIPQLAFIRDGEFNETKGKPTLKLIGSIETAGSTAKSFQGKVHVVKTQGIRATDVIRAFLMAENVSEPMSYLTQIAWESSAFLPCYYYLHLSGLGATQAIGVIEKEHSTSRAKVKLIERLKNDEVLSVAIPSGNNANGDRKLETRKNLLARNLRGDANDKDLGDILDMVRTLKKSDLPLSYIRELLLNIFNKNFAKQEQGLNDKIRRAICYIDWLHYGERVKP